MATFTDKNAEQRDLPSLAKPIILTVNQTLIFTRVTKNLSNYTRVAL